MAQIPVVAPGERTVHGWFDPALPPALTVEPGTTVRLGTLDSGWDDLDEAAAEAMNAILDLLGARYELGRTEALALASVAVDLRVTQVANRVFGVHAVLPHDAVRRPQEPCTEASG